MPFNSSVLACSFFVVVVGDEVCREVPTNTLGTAYRYLEHFLPGGEAWWLCMHAVFPTKQFNLS